MPRKQQSPWVWGIRQGPAPTWGPAAGTEPLPGRNSWHFLAGEECPKAGFPVRGTGHSVERLNCKTGTALVLVLSSPCTAWFSLWFPPQILAVQRRRMENVARCRRQGQPWTSASLGSEKLLCPFSGIKQFSDEMNSLKCSEESLLGVLSSLAHQLCVLHQHKENKSAQLISLRKINQPNSSPERKQINQTLLLKYLFLKRPFSVAALYKSTLFSARTRVCLCALPLEEGKTTGIFPKAGIQCHSHGMRSSL